MSNSVIKIDRVSLAYSTSNVVDDVSLTVKAGEFIGLIGPNAGGKTTLVKLMLGLINPSQGEIRILGTTPEKARTRIGYVQQRPVFNRNFPITVSDTVLMGTIGSHDFFGGYSCQQRQQGEKVLQLLDLVPIANQSLTSLSGGQLQRVWIARALVSEPEILILDEPTANIDVQAEENIFRLLKQHHSHITTILVSHDIAFISSYVDRVACMNQKLICHDVESIDGKTVEELYGSHVSMIHHEHAHA